MQATEQEIRQVVEEVLSQLGQRRSPVIPTVPTAADRGDWGVFDDVDAAVDAAQTAFEQLSESPVSLRATAVDIVKRICDEQAEELGRLELEETGIGRLDHKIAKLRLVRSIPGTEFLRSDAVSGDHGLTVTE